MDKKAAVSFKEWAQAIREARSFIADYDKNRWKVADIAMKVCDRSHGGRKGNHFSIKKFAEEIDLNPKTLYEWIKTKERLIDNRSMRLRKEALGKRAYTDLAIIASSLSEDVSKSQVISNYMNYFEQAPENLKFIKYGRFLKSLLFNASRPIQMLSVDSEVIVEMIKSLETILGCFKKELELREKYSPADRLLKDKKRIKSGVDEAMEL